MSRDRQLKQDYQTIQYLIAQKRYFAVSNKNLSCKG